MQSHQSAVFARPDTLLGVCEALGEDFRINPLFLRVPLAAFLIFYPVAVLSIYAAGAVLVLVSRLLAPNPRMTATPGQPVAIAAPEAQAHRNVLDTDNEAHAYAVAA